MSQTQIPVVYELWAALEASLLAQSKQLVRDIAQKEGANPKDLWARVSKEISFTPLELPEPVEPTFCSYQLRTSPIAQKCLRPVLLGHTYCSEHCERLSPSIPLHQYLPKVIRYQNDCDPGEIFFKKESTANTSNVVYSADLKPVGILHDSKLICFEFA